MAALRTLADTVTEPAGLAVQDGGGCFALFVREGEAGSKEGVIGGFPDPLYRQVRHGDHLPSGQRG